MSSKEGFIWVNLSSLELNITEIINLGTCYFLPSLNFPTLSFKREGAKEASFLDIKLFNV